MFEPPRDRQLGSQPGRSIRAPNNTGDLSRLPDLAGKTSPLLEGWGRVPLQRRPNDSFFMRLNFIPGLLALLLAFCGAAPVRAAGASPRTYADLAHVIAPMAVLIDSEYDRGQPISDTRRASHLCHELLAEAWGQDFLRYLELEAAVEADDTTANQEALDNFKPNARARDVVAGLRKFLPAMRDLQRVVGRQSRSRFEARLKDSQAALRYLEAFNRSKLARQLVILQSTPSN